MADKPDKCPCGHDFDDDHIINRDAQGNYVYSCMKCKKDCKDYRVKSEDVGLGKKKEK